MFSLKDGSAGLTWFGQAIGFRPARAGGNAGRGHTGEDAGSGEERDAACRDVVHRRYDFQLSFGDVRYESAVLCGLAARRIRRISIGFGRPCSPCRCRLWAL